MKNSNFKIAISLIVFVISLALLVGGYQLYMKYGLIDPLKQQLEARPAVASAAISRNEGQFEVALQLQGVDNLQEEYQAIQAILNNTLKEGSYRLHLSNPVDERLGAAYLHLQPAIYEAAANHSFVWLDKTLSQYAAETGLAYQLYVDDRYLYLQLAAGEQEMYRIVEVNTAGRSLHEEN